MIDYYPGTTKAVETVPVDVREGQGQDGVDFVMAVEPTTSVRVKILAPNPHPFVVTQLVVTSSSLPASIHDLVSSHHASRDLNGDYWINDLTPGDYWLSVRGRFSEEYGRNSQTRQFADPSGTLYGGASIAVGGQEKLDVELTLAEGQSLSGHAVLADAGSEDAADLKSTVVSLTPYAGDHRMTVPVPPAHVGSDGSFILSGIAPGNYRLRATRTSGGTLFVESVLFGETNARDVPIEVRPGESVSGLLVRLSNRSAHLSGTIRDGLDRPVDKGFVVAFPADPSLWELDPRDFPLPVRPSTDGEFALSLGSGKYLIALLTDIDPYNWVDKDLLERISTTSSVQITLNSGESKTLNLRVARQIGPILERE